MTPIHTRTTAATPPRARLARLARERSPHGPEAGVALVEFALVLPLFLVLILGMLDMGKAYNYWIDTNHLANEAARFAAVNRNPGPGGSLEESIRMGANTAELRNGGSDSVANSVQVSVGYPNGTCEVGDPVEVEVTATYNWLPFLDGKLNITESDIRGSATMRLEAEPDGGC